MTSEREFNALLRSWFEESAPPGQPQGLLESVLTATGRTRPRPAWLVRLGGEAMPEPGTSRLNRFAPLALAATALVVAILIGIGLLVRAPNVGPSPAPGPTHNTSAGWTATGSMVMARSGHTATLLPDGKVLVAGGNTGVLVFAVGTGDASNPQSSAELYNPTTGTWTATGSMVMARSGHTATLLPDGKVLVAGGNISVQAELYDPSTGTWTATGSMLTARSMHTATLLPDGSVLVAGGFDVTQPPGIGGSPEIVATAELYDPSTGSWSATGSMSTPRRDHTATRLTDGKVLVVGGYRNAIPGYDSGPASLNTAELYDPGTRRWSTTGGMSSARADHGATLLPGGKVLVEYGNGQGAELYDPSAGTWTAIWSPDIGGFVTATLLADGTVLTTFERQDTALYDPATDSWTDNLGTGREHLTLSGSGIFGAGATATLLDDGTVLVAGGSTNSAQAGTVTVQTWRQAELYHPGSAR